MIELAGIIILGIFAQWLAWRTRVPAILPLIIVGLVVGPLSTLFTPDGKKLLEPMYHPETGIGVFANEYLFYFVSLSIGIILFEGGLTLKRSEIRGVGPIILRLITLGPAITLVGGGFAAHYLMNLPWAIAFLFSALITVTGPTVIAPILRNTPLNRNVSTVLKWEGILIDPIGATLAVLVFEFIHSTSGSITFTSHALISFFQIILIGLALGTLGALGLVQLIKRELIPHYLLNVFTLAWVLGVFILSEILAKESGLLAMVVMGTAIGNMDVPRLKEILSFKESLSVLLISILFIILAANINMEDLNLVIRDYRSFVLLAFVAFILRPIGVFICTRDSELNFSEKSFISWVGPRGIVAAGVASLFGLTLTDEGVPGAEYLTPLVFLIVLGTVMLNATTARLVARLLGVTQDSSDGILFVGASLAARVLGKYLIDNKRRVVLVDNNHRSVQKAREMGLEALVANIYTQDLEEDVELVDVGYLIAMTSSAEVNAYAVRKYEKIFGELGTFRLITPEELRRDPEELPKTGLLSYADDFLNINEIARDYPYVHEVRMQSVEELKATIRDLAGIDEAIPIFIKEGQNHIYPLPPDLDQVTADGPFDLVYLGKEVEFEKKPSANIGEEVKS